MSEKGYKLLYFRQKIFKTEIDLVMMAPEGHLVLVEVKSMSNEWSLVYRVTSRQRQRLERCRSICENKFEIPTELLFVYVYGGDIVVLNVADLI